MLYLDIEIFWECFPFLLQLLLATHFYVNFICPISVNMSLQILINPLFYHSAM